MAFDQNITYRVNVDDSNFQAKLTQMRASMDASMGGGGGGGFSSSMMYGMMGAYGSGGGMNFMGGMSDFGSQIRPVTFTPPAIAMQPHFGMYQVQQTLAQAGLGAMGGPIGAGIGGMMTNFNQGGFRGMMNGPGAIPENISMAEYLAMSARGYGDRVGDMASVGAMTIGGTTASLAAGGMGSAIGASMFTGGLMRAVGGLAGGMVGGMAVSQYMGAVTDFMADNRQMQSALGAGSFRFMTGGGPEVDQLTGRGMGRRSRANVASSMQDMEMNDLRYGTNDYKQILEGGMQYDMFSGTRDVEDFKGKFKGLVENLKTITSTLHTSLKEGIEVIRGFRDMGVTDPSEINRLTMGSEMRGRMAGRTGQEMLAVGQAGAEIFRGTGIDMNRGFELNQMNVTTVRGLLNSGGLSRESIAQAGGENALAQQMTASALAGFQTAHGRAAMMANFNASSGTMNPNMVTSLAGGGIMNQVAGASAMGPAGIIKFQAHQEELISSMGPQAMQMFNIATGAGMAQHLVSATGVDFESAYRFSKQSQGVSKSVIDAELGMLRQDPSKMMQDQQSAVANMRTQASLEDVRNRFNIGKRVGNFFSRNLVAPVGRWGVELSTDIGESIDNLSLSMSGAAHMDAGLTSRGLIERGEALLGGGGENGAIDVSGSAYQNLIGGQTGRGLMERFLKSGDMSYGGVKARQFDSMEEAVAAGKREGTSFNVAKASNGKFIGVTDGDVMKLTDSARSMQFTAKDREDAGREELSEKVGIGMAKLGANDNLDAAINVMFAGKVSMGDLRGMSSSEFESKYGKSKGHYTARADRYFKQYGGMTPEAAKQFHEALDTEATGNLSASERAEIGKRGTEAAGGLMSDLSSALPMSTWFSGANVTNSEGGKESILGLLQNNKEALAEFYSADSSDVKSARLAKLTGYSGGWDKAISRATSGISAERRADQIKMSDDISKSAALAERVAQQAVGGSGDGLVGGKTIGDLSKDTLATIEAQSGQLLANYKQLIALQEKLNGLMKAGH